MSQSGVAESLMQKKREASFKMLLFFLRRRK
jgi:hypothetical protein